MNRGPDSQVVPVAEGGHGAYTWERSQAHHYYRIRRGARPVGSVSLSADVSHHARILDGFCEVLDERAS